MSALIISDTSTGRTLMRVQPQCHSPVLASVDGESEKMQYGESVFKTSFVVVLLA